MVRAGDRLGCEEPDPESRQDERRYERAAGLRRRAKEPVLQPALAVTLIVGIFGPTANGDRFTLFQILLATAASTLIVALLIAATYYRLPWRKLPDADAALVPVPVEVELPRPQPVKSDAYAESP